MGIKFVMWCIIVLLLIVVVVWFMEGYYIGRYDNDLTRLWREHVIDSVDDDDDDF